MINKNILTLLLSILLLTELASIDVNFSVPSVSFGSIDSKGLVTKVSRVTKPYPATFVSALKSRNSILFVGDVLLARNVEYLMNKNGSEYPYSGLNFGDISIDPYVFGNFEASIPEVHIQTETLKMNFSVDSIYLEAAKNAGFTHFSLANNHSFDFGQSGLLNTRYQLKNADLGSFGDPKKLSKDSVTFLQLKDSLVSVIGIHALEKQPTQEEIDSLVSYAGSKSDIQIAYIHWGIEYQNISDKSQRLLAQKLVDAGVDLIIGHHPHVVQEIDLIDGVPVFYSLGNYIFDQYASADVQESLLLDIEFADQPYVYLIPVSSQYTLSQPTYMSDNEAKKFLLNVADRSDTDLKKYIENGVIPLNILVATSSKIAMMNR